MIEYVIEFSTANVKYIFSITSTKLPLICFLIDIHVI